MKKRTILLTFDLPEEPNETQATAITFNGNKMSFKGFSGFAARDIFDLLYEKGEDDE